MLHHTPLLLHQPANSLPLPARSHRPTYAPRWKLLSSGRLASTHAAESSTTPGPNAPRKSLPLPTPSSTLPLIGNLVDFFRAPFFPKQLKEWADELGGLYQINFLGSKYVVVTDSKLIPQIVGRGSSHVEPPLDKSAGYKMWAEIETTEHGTYSLFSNPDSSSDVWKNVRRSFGRALGPGQMRPLFPDAVSSSEQFVSCILRSSCPWATSAPLYTNATTADTKTDTPASHGHASVDINAISKKLTLDVIGKATLEMDWGFLNGSVEGSPLEHIPELILEGMHEIVERSRAPLRILFPFLMKKQREEGDLILHRFREICKGLLATIRERGEPAADNERTWAGIIRLGKDGVSDAQLCSEIAALLVGGYETTANALTWAVFSLVAHQGSEERLLAELQGAGLMHADGRAGLCRPVEFDDLAKLPVLEAFINESMRLYSTAPNGTIRATDKEYQLGDHTIEPNTVVWISFTALHTSKNLWERPDEFVLDRWLEPLSSRTTESGAALGTTDSSASRCPFASPAEQTASLTRSARAIMSETSSSKSIKFMPFGDGGRSCVGRHLALLELKLALIYLVANLTVKLDDSINTIEQVLERQRVKLTLEPEGGLWMNFARRQGGAQ